MENTSWFNTKAGVLEQGIVRTFPIRSADLSENSEVFVRRDIFRRPISSTVLAISHTLNLSSDISDSSLIQAILLSLNESKASDLFIGGEVLYGSQLRNCELNISSQEVVTLNSSWSSLSKSQAPAGLSDFDTSNPSFMLPSCDITIGDLIVNTVGISFSRDVSPCEQRAGVFTRHALGNWSANISLSSEIGIPKQGSINIVLDLGTAKVTVTGDYILAEYADNKSEGKENYSGSGELYNWKVIYETT